MATFSFYKKKLTGYFNAKSYSINLQSNGLNYANHHDGLERLLYDLKRGQSWAWKTT
jgi:hypothetical protein